MLSNVSGAGALRYGAYTCFALAAILLILAVVLFFVFHIKELIYELSGKAKEDSTRKMQKSYAVTGGLRSFSATEETKKKSQGQSQSQGLFLTGQLPNQQQNVSAGTAQMSAAPETSALQNTAAQTTALRKNAGKEIDTNAPETQSLRQNQPKKQAAVNIRITKDVLVIHTNEHISK